LGFGVTVDRGDGSVLTPVTVGTVLMAFLLVFLEDRGGNYLVSDNRIQFSSGKQCYS
jgi:hypothetical protein